MTFYTALLSSILAQTIYGANGQHKGYSQTTPSGVTSIIYNLQGQNIQSFQTDNGQTNFYNLKDSIKAVTPLQFKPYQT
ncbi:hypothetical protein DP176_08395 [Polynucleobacter paneuropaeus]|uniref:Uncharacterized protein n=1 Tax=Polynucleobacter paneuropaeus TaxID=2527775 RepID=A0ABX9FBE6_9BURK|nr:hypothetical protein [Polynucleobacter paneuropaeus]RAZ40806.1 hypothetical protein DP176_08395 [Polynucleobacter paneuropaeus]